MTRSPLLTLTALCGFGFFASDANAADAPCTSYAGLADVDRDGFCAFLGKSDATSTGWSGKVDCDDENKSVHPGAPEVVKDGIDQNCVSGDLVLPVEGAAYQRYVANAYGGRAPKPEMFAVEYKRCQDATKRCVPNDEKGRFDIADPEKDTFRDIYAGTGKVLEMDGYREVVTLEEASHFRGGSAGSSGPSKATRTAEALAVATPLVVAETKARTEADDVLGGRIDGEAKARTEADIGLGERIDKVDEAAVKLFEKEEKDRKEGDETLAEATATAMRNARAAASHGSLIEAYALGGGMYGSPVTDNGRVVRNSFGGGAGAGINVGVDGNGYRLNAFVDTIIGADGGAGPAHSEAIGVEFVPDDGLWFLPPHTGIFAAYGVRHTQPNAMESQVVGKNPILGLSVAVPFAQNDAVHGLVGGRLGCGPQFDGIAGDRVTSSASIGCRGEIVLGGGVGALQ